MTPEYIIVRERANGSAWRGVAEVGALGALSVLLYFLVKNLGLGGRSGASGKPALPAPPLPPPGDSQRLTFVMTQPTPDAPSLPMSFRGPDARSYSLDEMIARVRAGGRSDVVLKIAGTVRAGSAESAKALIKKAGIQIWTEGDTRVSGVANGRGQYGARRWSIS